MTTRFWKSGILTALLAGGYVMALPSAASAQSECYAIKDANMKNYCLATTKRDKSYCYNIKDGDQKNLCLAEVGRDRSRCYDIKARDLKNRCLATVPR